MRGLYTEEARALLFSVAAGNPGAMRVADELTYFSDWPDMMLFLAKHGPRGADLWVLYKDVHKQNALATGDDIHQQMRAARDGGK